MKKMYKLVDYWKEESDNPVHIPYDDENGLDMKILHEAVNEFFENSSETFGKTDQDIAYVEELKGDAENGFTVIVCVDPELDGLIEEIYLKEIV